jgi:meso-butanediol dehydrogenase / (S,S)-butanediol dehydrogenase / diacetyl reductase
MSRLADKSTRRRVAVVTGGGRGLGRGISGKLAKAGCDLVLGWRSDQAGVEGTADELRGYGATAVAVQGDVKDSKTAIRLAEAALGELGGLDIWVNNAGISRLAPVLDTSTSDMESMMDVNFFGTFHGLQVAAAVMKEAGRGGRIINVASDLGLVAAPLLAGYSASKFAVIGLTQAAALELAQHGVSVNAVCPGTVETDMVAAEEVAEAELTGKTQEAVRQRLRDSVPAGRLCTVDDVAALVGWLASPEASFVTGQAICTNGGSILH